MEAKLITQNLPFAACDSATISTFAGLRDRHLCLVPDSVIAPEGYLRLTSQSLAVPAPHSPRSPQTPVPVG